jgi:hypothetical protein
VRVNGPMFLPLADGQAFASSLDLFHQYDRFHQYEQGRLAALDGENLDTLLRHVPREEVKYWLNGWRVGLRQRLYREACVDATRLQLLELVAAGWTHKEIERALRLREGCGRVSAYLSGKSLCRPNVAERIKVLCEEVKKADGWLFELGIAPTIPGTGGDRPHHAAGARRLEEAYKGISFEEGTGVVSVKTRAPPVSKLQGAGPLGVAPPGGPSTRAAGGIGIGPLEDRCSFERKQVKDNE